MMNKEKQLELKALCPNLYKILLLSDQEIADAKYGRWGISNWGFECEDGWFEIIKELSLKLEPIIEKLPEEQREFTYAVQVKEKFGTLRFYMNSYTDEMGELISEAEKKSETTCEISGKQGKLMTDAGWWKTLSEEEEKKWKEKRNVKISDAVSKESW